MRYLFHIGSDRCRLLIIIIGNLDSCGSTACVDNLTITDIKCHMIYITISIEYQISRFNLTTP